MLRCEGWKAKRVYSLYTEDGLAVRTKVRGKIALRARVPALRATRPNEKWSMDFHCRATTRRALIPDADGDRSVHSRMRLVAGGQLADCPEGGVGVSQAVAERGAPVSITVDN